MNEDSLASDEIHAAIAKVLNDYYKAASDDPPDLKQRTWHQVAPWLTFARATSTDTHAHMTNDNPSFSEPHTPQHLAAQTRNAAIIRVIAVIVTLILIALFVSVVLPTLSH